MKKEQITRLVKKRFFSINIEVENGSRVELNSTLFEDLKNYLFLQNVCCQERFAVAFS